MTLTKTNKQQYITGNNEKLLQAVKFVSEAFGSDFLVIC